MTVDIELFQVLYSQWQGNTINLTDGMSKTTESGSRNDTLQQLTDQRRTNWRVIFPRKHSLTDDDNSRHISGSQNAPRWYSHISQIPFLCPLALKGLRPQVGYWTRNGGMGTGAALRPYFTHFRANSVFGHYAPPHYSVISKTSLLIIQFPRIRKLDFVRDRALKCSQDVGSLHYEERNQ